MPVYYVDYPDDPDADYERLRSAVVIADSPEHALDLLDAAHANLSDYARDRYPPRQYAVVEELDLTKPSIVMTDTNPGC